MLSASLLKRSAILVLLGGALTAQDFVKPRQDPSLEALRSQVRSLELRVRALESQLNIKSDPYRPEIIPVQGQAKPDK
jgi:hypothetical protein